jgi:hypothetical protein
MIAALIALSVAASPAEQLTTEQLPSVFAAACLDGTAQLTNGDAVDVGFAGLPESLRKRLGTPRSAHAWHLNSPGSAYLYSLEYAPDPSNAEKICGLASDEMSIGRAAELLRARVLGPSFKHSEQTIEWIRAEDGYNAIVTQAAEFTVLQVNWLSPQQKRIVLRRLRQLGIRQAKSGKVRN